PGSDEPPRPEPRLPAAHRRAARRRPAADTRPRDRRQLALVEGTLHRRAVGRVPGARLSALRGPCPAAAAGRALGRRVRPVGRGPGRVPPVRAGGRAMNLRAIGCNVESADVAIREKLAFDDARLRSALAELSARYGAEAVVLGTCNRVEIYLARP